MESKPQVSSLPLTQVRLPQPLTPQYTRTMVSKFGTGEAQVLAWRRLPLPITLYHTPAPPAPVTQVGTRSAVALHVVPVVVLGTATVNAPEHRSFAGAPTLQVQAPQVAPETQPVPLAALHCARPRT